MHIITQTHDEYQGMSWQQILAQSVKTVAELITQLALDTSQIERTLRTKLAFPLLVPPTFVARMQKGDWNDPLLRQILPVQHELQQVEGFGVDPLGEQVTNVQKGIIHKYRGRVLLIAASGCAINCRYCFRRHFPYQENRVGREQWQHQLQYIAEDSSISEVILSGGDPLMLSDSSLAELLEQIAAIPHVRRFRIHSRLPVVIPQRLTDELLTLLQRSRLKTTLVLHVNHPQELSAEHAKRLPIWHRSGIHLLNQSVLLKDINDCAEVLIELSERLFELDVLPYYLHVLDRVQGAHHFEVAETQAKQLHQQLLANLPGYLVPKLVREIAGEPNKTPLQG